MEKLNGHYVVSDKNFEETILMIFKTKIRSPEDCLKVAGSATYKVKQYEMSSSFKISLFFQVYSATNTRRVCLLSSFKRKN